MKLVTLVENTASDPVLTAEHGLSLYMEANGYKILFDMGQTDAFARNGEKLGIDLSQVDLAILSHGHYDHGGGLREFLKINTKAPVYLHAEAFGAYYNGTQKYIGLDLTLKESARLRFCRGTRQLAPGLLLTDCNDLGWETQSYGLNRRQGEDFAPDPFCHEHYLQITEGDRKILISGCSHKGIQNIAGYFLPDVLVGGFHLNKVEDPGILRELAVLLESYGSRYYTGHCTGQRQFAEMKQVLGERLESISAGTVIHI